MLSGYGRTYRKTLRERHRHLDLSGIAVPGSKPVELSSLYVDLSLREVSPNRALVNPAQAPAPERQGQPSSSHTIWSLLSSKDLEGSLRLLILGPPGSGKTLLLKHVTLTLAQRSGRGGRKNVPKLAPILVLLDKDLAAEIHADPTRSLAEVVRASVGDLRKAEPDGWFKDRLARGKCLVMFDGLDNIADADHRHTVGGWIADQFSRYPGVHFILTSRPARDLSAFPAAVEVVEVASFSPDQVERFLSRWRSAGPHARIHERSESVSPSDLLTRLRERPEFWPLAGNPMLLTMIVGLDGDGPGADALRQRRGDLYRAICNGLLSRRPKSLAPFDPDRCRRLFEALAHHMVEARVLEIAAVDALPVLEPALAAVGHDCAGFLRAVSEASGLLVERDAAGSGRYAFAHRTFQEFLAAEHLLTEGTITDVELGELVGESWWRETLRFYAAGGEASRVVEACMQGATPTVEALSLAAACVEDSECVVTPDLETRLNSMLTDEEEQGRPERRHILHEVRLTLRVNRMVPLGAAASVSPTLITNAEYQLFAEAKARHLDHWHIRRFSRGQGDRPAVGVRSSDAEQFCRWLTERDRDGWRYRLPFKEELKARLPAINVPHWEQDEEGLRCWPSLDQEAVRDLLKRQLRFDLMQELSPSMRQRIDPQRWGELRKLVPHDVPGGPHMGLDPRLVYKLDLVLPGEALTALGVALAGRDHRVQADRLGAQLGLTSLALSDGRAVVQRTLSSSADTAAVDCDSIIKTADQLYASITQETGQSEQAEAQRIRLLALALKAATDCALNRAERSQPERRQDEAQEARVLRWCARLSALALGHATLRSDDRPLRIPAPLIRFLPNFHLDHCLSVYTGLALVEARERGDDSAGAGIVIVKEPAEDRDAIGDSHSRRFQWT
ncbi:MAG: NACHT domain-containing protein [Egibacteraceae bacterium]